MAFDYAPLASTAKSLLAQFGQTVTLTKGTPIRTADPSRPRPRVLWLPRPRLPRFYGLCELFAFRLAVSHGALADSEGCGYPPPRPQRAQRGGTYGGTKPKPMKNNQVKSNA